MPVPQVRVGAWKTFIGPGPMAGKCPHSGVWKELEKLPSRDRIIERAMVVVAASPSGRFRLIEPGLGKGLLK